jgi:phage terminase large subunit
LLKENSSSLFYKRNYLGLWCLAEGAIFDFFDRSIYVVDRPPRTADYWILGIDYGTSNAFAAVLIGVSTGIHQQMSKQLWVEQEYYWDSKKRGRQKMSSEYADDIYEMIKDYTVKGVYIDPSAASFKLDLAKKGIHCISADNDVENGIITLISEMRKGNLLICKTCPNLIREVEGYVWDPKASAKGYDEPIKSDDHSIDALRYAIHTHKVTSYKPYKDENKNNDYMQNRFNPGGRKF